MEDALYEKKSRDNGKESKEGKREKKRGVRILNDVKGIERKRVELQDAQMDFEGVQTGLIVKNSIQTGSDKTCVRNHHNPHFLSNRANEIQIGERARNLPGVVA